MKNKTKAEITGLTQVENRLKNFLKAVGRDQTVLEDIGNEVVDQIRKRTQAGLEDYKQPDIKTSTIEARKFLSDKNGTGPFFKPARSNVTMSGQLLRALTFKLSAAASQISIFLVPDRYQVLPLTENEREIEYQKLKPKGRKQSAKRVSSDNAKLAGLRYASTPQKELTNVEVKRDLEERGRRFFFISKALSATLSNRLKQNFRRKLAEYKRLVRTLK